MPNKYNLQAVARRKNLPKFGMSKEDRPGPNPQTTIVAEDVFMQFIAGKVGNMIMFSENLFWRNFQ